MVPSCRGNSRTTRSATSRRSSATTSVSYRSTWRHRTRDKRVLTSLLMREPLKVCCQQSQRFGARLIPRSFVFLLVVLAWLTAFAVVWPLLVLPGLAASSTKGWIMVTFVVGLVGLFGFFAYQLYEVWRLGKFHWGS